MESCWSHCYRKQNCNLSLVNSDDIFSCDNFIIRDFLKLKLSNNNNRHHWKQYFPKAFIMILRNHLNKEFHRKKKVQEKVISTDKINIQGFLWVFNRNGTISNLTYFSSVPCVIVWIPTRSRVIGTALVIEFFTTLTSLNFGSTWGRKYHQC